MHGKRTAPTPPTHLQASDQIHMQFIPTWDGHPQTVDPKLESVYLRAKANNCVITNV